MYITIKKNEITKKYILNNFINKKISYLKNKIKKDFKLNNNLNLYYKDNLLNNNLLLNTIIYGDNNPIFYIDNEKEDYNYDKIFNLGVIGILLTLIIN